MLIVFLQLFRPFLGPDNICPFTIGCTEYAIMQLQEVSLWLAIIRILKRLMLCNPITNLFKKKSPAA